MIVLTFDPGLATLAADDFLNEILVRRLGAGAVSSAMISISAPAAPARPPIWSRPGQKRGLIVEIVEKVVADEEGSLTAVSSTATREALMLGDVRGAAALLGHPWSLTGPVIHGAKLGRQLGFPTANLAVDPACRLRHAIYAVEVEVDGQRLKGVASFGRRPTVDDGPPLLEVYIFDFAADIYGKEIEVFFIDFLRPEQKFESLEELVAQIGRDEIAAREKLGA